MKLIGTLLVIVSLAAGALAAATAYLVPLDLPTEKLVGLVLSADAGAMPGPPGKQAPLVHKGQTLTAALVRTLRDNDVHYVKVSEFLVERWPFRWAFAGAVMGLLGGALCLRLAARREVAAAGASRDAEGPERALRAIRQTVDDLRRDQTEPGRLAVILERIGALQRTHLPAFAEARPLLIARFGLGGYAGLMDRYAAAERQLYRAWSAAADGVLEESVSCLDQAALLLDEAEARLGGTG